MMLTKKNRDETTRARRQLIVETAALCFIEKGFHQTSIRDIAKRAGISLGNLYNHFDNKNALIAEIATLEADDLRGIEEKTSAEDAAPRALERFIDLYFAYCERPENIMLSAEITAEGLRNPEIIEGFLANRQALVKKIAGFIDAGLKDGAYRAELESDDLAEPVLDLIERSAMRSAFETAQPATKEIATVNELVRALLRAV